jgi:hypothetical protein
MEAAKTFHTRWRGILGLDYNPDAPKAWVLIGGVDSALAWEVGHVGRLASQCAGGRSWAARFSLAGSR